MILNLSYNFVRNSFKMKLQTASEYIGLRY
jgi:hypothetical protein